MVSAEVFAGYVRDALAHLYDRPYLRSHPLGSLFGVGRPISEDALRRLLLDALESLRPPVACPPSAPAWRRYRYLELRYVEGATPEQTAQELRISVRQSQRERDRAIDDVASWLWARYESLAQPGPLDPVRSAHPPVIESDPSTEPGPPAERRAAAEVVRDELFDELVKVGSLPPSEPIGLSDAFQGAFDVVARLAEDRGARLDLALPEALPGVRVHRLVLRQALIDLLESAIESQAGALVRVSAEVVAAVVRLEISVPRAQAAGSTHSSDVDARLAATRKLLELQGGRLDVRPGAEVAFRALADLPLTRDRTLLVIDDNPDIAFLFSRLLRGHNYRVLQASTGPTALQLCREARPDAITLDVLMPTQDGWDLLRALAHDPATSRIPVILCSVLPERSLALSLGVAGFLNKPVTRESLLEVLQQCLPDSRAG